jgi:hypothetical protein
MNRIYFYLLIALLFSGCDINDFIPKEPDSPELKEKALLIKQQSELAELKARQELASIESNKEIELGKLNKDIKIKELELKNAQELERLKLQIEIEAAERDYSMKRNMLLMATLFMIIVAYGLYVLLKRRHDKKLQAYNDNLKKYFYQKEQDARMRLAEKIVDTVASGKATSEQEAKLLSLLNAPENINTQHDDDDDHPQTIDIKEIT